MKNKKVYLAVIFVVLLGLSGYVVKDRFFAAERENAGKIYSDAGVSVVKNNADAAPEGGSSGGQGDAGTPAAGTGTNVKQSGSNQPDTSPATGSLSNARRGWGLKRNNDHRQPEMPSSISATLSKYGAYWIGGPNEKVLYLTFDEGYENGYTARILDTLKANDVKAAFFITGHYLNKNPELVKRMVEEGHIVGNHTDTHPSLPDVSNEQIKKELQTVSDGFEKLTGQKGMKYLRPPKGEYSERTLAETRALGYHNIFWSLALVDWVPMPGGSEEAYRSVMDNLHNGSLILLHAVSKDVTGALDRILKDAKAQGYTFKSLDDLVKQ